MKIYERFSDAEMKRLGLTGNMPKHVGIIMDGNGRWAKSRMLPRSLGHRAGMDALQEIVRVSKSIGIEALTVYAFSTENWLRPEQEVNALFLCSSNIFIKRLMNSMRIMYESTFSEALKGSAPSFGSLWRMRANAPRRIPASTLPLRSITAQGMRSPVR